VADKCIDTCCANWVINVTEENKKFYEAEVQEIAKEVEPYGGDEFRMRECDNGACVQLEEGLCKIHKNFGETFLPDVCYTFPRAYKKIDEDVYMTANLACPESLRVALYNNKQHDFSAWSNITQSRVKPDVYNSRFSGINNLSHDEVINLFNLTTKMVDDSHYTSDEALARLVILASEMENNPEFNWQNITSEMQKIDQEKLVTSCQGAEISESDALNQVLRAMFVLVNRDRPRYNVVMKMMREILGDNNSNSEILAEKFHAIKNSWHGFEKNFDGMLKNLIKAQLAYAMFPVAYGNKYHAIIVVALEYLVIKLALMSKCHELQRGYLTQAEVVDVIQPTAKRFYVRRNQELLDFCKEVGWEDLKKMTAIVLNFSA
jgi:lysine-N-methylase